jgi:hypothetical protein
VKYCIDNVLTSGEIDAPDIEYFTVKHDVTVIDKIKRRNSNPDCFI